MKPISMNSQPPHHKGQHGLTLIEVMISITISLILLAGVMQIFTGSRQTYRVQDNVARLQENGRFAISFLSKDLRMAGYTGCTSKSTTVTVIATNTAASFPNGGLTGYEYAALPITLTATDTLTAAMVLPGTDIVQIKGASSTGVNMTGNLATVNANIQLLTATADGLFTAGDILFISDCTNADIFAATNVSNGAGTTTIAHAAGNTTNNLSKTYGTDADVMKMESSVYYIAADATNNNIPTLYRKRMVGVAMVTEPLVEGVEDMEILYGEDTDAPATPDGSANRYVAADTPGLNMTNVVSVRLNLLLRSSEDNLATGTKQTYSFNGNSVTATDYRLRRVFSTTIKVRNKGL